MISLLVIGCLILAAGAALAIPAAGLLYSYRAWQQERSTAPRRLRVAARRDLTADVFELHLKPLWWSPRLPPFQAGQHLSLLVPVTPESPAQRAYTLAAWRENPSRYVLSIKRESMGLVSTWLHRNAQPGCRLDAIGPKGHFHAGNAGNSDEILLIAAGIGITPMRAMLHSWTTTAAPRRVTLHFTARDHDGLYYHDEFTDLSERHDWFCYRPRLTGPQHRDAGWNGDNGRLTIDHLATSVRSAETAHAFICAGKTMEIEVAANLLTLGLHPDQIHREAFGLATAATDIEATIRFRGKDIAFARAPSILHAVERAGLKIEADCRAGDCGYCRVQIHAGKARNLLTGAEETESALACCSVPVGDLIISA